MCCPSRRKPVASRDWLVHATVIVTVRVGPDPYPIWWRGIAAPPPAQWAYVFEEMTGEDSAEEWALAAAIFIAQTRRRTSLGPTFSELFAHLLPDSAGLPSEFPSDLTFPERRRAITGFRGHVAIEWRRRGMINWDRDVTRSLRVGRAFRERSRRRQLIRSAPCTRSEPAVRSTPEHPEQERPR